MRVTNQGGSLAGFIIIGVLLTLVLVGGLFGLNRYNAQRAADQIAASEKATAEESAETDATKTDAPSASSQSRTDQTPKDTAAQPQPQPAAQSTGAAKSAQLPQTGPADTLIGFIAVAALTFAVVHYTRSRA